MTATRPHVLVTGASQGIGAAVAEAFAEATDGEVWLSLVARDRENLEATAARCQKAGAETRVHLCDVTDPAAVGALAVEAEAAFGPVDVLVNNAGRFVPGAFQDTSLADFDAQLAVNLRSTFLVTQAFLPAMRSRRRGDIINLCSICSFKVFRGTAAYTTAKHALLGLTRALREDLKADGIRVVALLPGATHTPTWDAAGVNPDRLMPAADVAQACVHAWRLGPNTVVEEIVLRPLGGDI